MVAPTWAINRLLILLGLLEGKHVWSQLSALSQRVVSLLTGFDVRLFRFKLIVLELWSSTFSQSAVDCLFCFFFAFFKIPNLPPRLLLVKREKVLEIKCRNSEKLENWKLGTLERTKKNSKPTTTTPIRSPYTHVSRCAIVKTHGCMLCLIHPIWNIDTQGTVRQQISLTLLYALVWYTRRLRRSETLLFSLPDCFVRMWLSYLFIIF